MTTTSPLPVATAHRRYLHRLLSRARRPRWRTQALRRRPWVVRPLTPGEQSLLSYRLLAQELAGLLEPFRRTRLRGHGEVDELLRDADSRPTVRARVLELQACLDRASAEHVRRDNDIVSWHQQWARATPAQLQHLIQVEKALAISDYHSGLKLLIAEGKADVGKIQSMCPAAFATPVAPEPWLDGQLPVGPTPYSK